MGYIMAFVCLSHNQSQPHQQFRSKALYIVDLAPLMLQRAATEACIDKY